MASLKKFRCLLGHGMQIVPDRACDIITAWCILCNISKDMREPDLDPDGYQQEDGNLNDNNVADENIAAAAAGNAVRANIIDNFFV